MSSRRLHIVASLFALLSLRSFPASAAPELPVILPNDNRHAAGTVLDDNTLSLNLRAAKGLWRPEGEEGPALLVEAFGADDGALQVPAPLIRVREGTSIVVSIRNDLDSMLTVHGLCARDGERCAPVEVPPTETSNVRFTIDRAGTYHYWATTTGVPFTFRGARDAQLSGALVVDLRDAEPDADRVLVITEWTSLTPEQVRAIGLADDPGVEFNRINPRLTFLINGLSWPATERLTYRLGETVRWRVINLSSQRHPMHMHGFYFEVDSLGDGQRDTPFAAGQRPRVVTQVMHAGSTMAMTWKPERAGNWLFHCHLMLHVSPDRRLQQPAEPHRTPHAVHDPSAGMASMILGVTVLGTSESTETHDVPPASPRRLTLTMQAVPGRHGATPGYGFALSTDEDAAPAEKASVPGPTLVLRRGEAVEITLVNRLTEGTAIHWHGMELDSYYDGVHGWSGLGSKVTPLITPGGRFIVRFTPPRTGTFIYHTHLHDHRQLASGLYGALLVVDPGEAGTLFDPIHDHVFVIGRSGPKMDAPVVLNGEREPQVVWKAGARHRVRLINITPDDIFIVSLQTMGGSVSWRALTKDGAPVPPDRRDPSPARQMIAVGETYDFEVETPPGRQNLWLEVRTTGGKWAVQGQVIVK